MASAIDSSIPADLAAVDKALVRANFAAAKSEIEALQSSVSTIQNTYSPTLATARNHIINGSMRVDQLNDGANVNLTTSGRARSVDKWHLIQGTDGAAVTPGTLAVRQFSNSGIADNPYYLRVATTAATTGVVDTSVVRLHQNIEGWTSGQWLFGTVNAKKLSLRFTVRSSMTGKMSGSLRSARTGGRNYVFEYTITSANVWQDVTIQIPGDTSGSWLTGPALGAVLQFTLAAHANQTGAANTWSSTLQHASTGSVFPATTVGATWDVTKVQLEIGDASTEFEQRYGALELLLCQRYQYVAKHPILIYGVATAATQFAAAHVPFPVAMPTNVIVNVTGTMGSPVNNTGVILTSGNGLDGVNLVITSSAAGQFSASVGNYYAYWDEEK